ncbi:hypothetical protein C9975_11820, partial [Thalassospira xiamenensis]
LTTSVWVGRALQGHLFFGCLHLLHWHREAENGQQAIGILKEQVFDLVVTDFNMPEMNGRELAEFIRQEPGLSHIPVLMVTARATSPQLANIKQSGVDALTDKPFEPATLRDLLARLLDH